MNLKEQLIEKLYQQYQNKATDHELLLTIQQLLSVLHTPQSNEVQGSVTIVPPQMSFLPVEPTVEEPPLNERANAISEKPANTAAPKTSISKLIEKELSFFQQYEENIIAENCSTAKENHTQKTATNPSLSDTKAIEINEKLRDNGRKEIIETHPIKDLKLGIGINDRYLFISELFHGDATVYERSIITINNFSNLKESMSWIERELRLTYFWDESDKTVQQFYDLVRRRFA